MVEPCPHHADQDRRLTGVEHDIGSIRGCQVKIKAAAATETERGKAAHRRIDETNGSVTELRSDMKIMRDVLEQRDLDQDRRINKQSVQLAGVIALLQVLFYFLS